VRALLALLVGAFGLGAWLRRRQRLQPRAYDFSPAEELRAKLAETRASDEPARTDASPPQPGRDPDSRRQDVHDRARQRIDELH